MSTLQETLTLISKSDGAIIGDCVKSENANSDCVKNFEYFGEEEPKENTKESEEKLIIDIKPTILQQHSGDTKWIPSYSESSNTTFSNTKKTILKRRLSEFLKSLCVLCDICDDISTQRVIKLNRNEKIVAALILRKGFGIGVRTKKISCTKIPEQSCGRCFTKIILLYNHHKNKSSEKQIKQESGTIMEQSSHGYHCQCLTCKNQYGDLPVLLKGIEEQKKMQTSQLQVNFQSEHRLNIPHTQDLPTLQQPVTISQNPDVNYQQYSVKYEEYEPIQSQQPFQTSQSSTPEYGHFQMSEDQMEVSFQPTRSEAELSLGQHSSDFTVHHRLNVDESQFEVDFQEESNQYYVSPASARAIAESGSCPQEQHFPTSLQELEEKCQIELASQPSTSRGQTHSQEDRQSKKIMTCVHCDKNFTHKGDFNKHLRKHTKEKPYKCSVCDKMFSHTSNLHRHQRIHSGDRPFRCEYCDKCFNRKDKLESHKNSKFCKNRRSWE